MSVNSSSGSTSNEIHHSDVTNKLDKLHFNNFVVGLKEKVKQGLVHTINKLTRDASVLKNKKTKCKKEEEKNTRRAERYLQEVRFLKSFHPRDIAKFSSLYKKTFSEVGANPQASIEERALCRISEHKGIKSAVKTLRDKYPNWEKEIPVIIKSLGLNYRKKRIQRLSELGELQKVTAREKKLLLLLHEYAGLELDPKMLRGAIVKLTKDKNKNSQSLNEKKEKKVSGIKSKPDQSLCDNEEISADSDSNGEENASGNESGSEESSDKNESDSDGREGKVASKFDGRFSGLHEVKEKKMEMEENNNKASCGHNDEAPKVDGHNNAASIKASISVGKKKKMKENKSSNSETEISSIFRTVNENSDCNNESEVEIECNNTAILVSQSAEMSSKLKKNKNKEKCKISNLNPSEKRNFFFLKNEISEVKQLDLSKLAENEKNIQASNKLDKLSDSEDEEFLKHTETKITNAKSSFFIGGNENNESSESENELKFDTQEDSSKFNKSGRDKNGNNPTPYNRYERRRQQFGDRDILGDKKKRNKTRDDGFRGKIVGRGRREEAFMNKKLEIPDKGRSILKSTKPLHQKRKFEINVSVKEKEIELHPSWEAKRKIAEHSGIVEFKGIRKTFD